jgi:hypothetical protein
MPTHPDWPSRWPAFLAQGRPSDGVYQNLFVRAMSISAAEPGRLLMGDIVTGIVRAAVAAAAVPVPRRCAGGRTGQRPFG